MQNFQLNLTLPEIQLIGECLGKGEYMKVRDLITKMENQVNGQLAELEAELEAKREAENAKPESEKIRERLNPDNKNKTVKQPASEPQ